MFTSRTISEIRLVNGSTGDPALFIDHPGRNDALLFDAGDNAAIDMARLGDLGIVFITHHHIDHFMGLDRIVRANLDKEKTLRIYGPEATIRRIYARITSYDHPFFPFQKLVIEVHELLDGRRRSARLDCARHFPEPEVEEVAWDGPVVLATDDLTIEATPVDHTVPCLAFALVEATGARIAYVTDTAWSERARPGLLRLARGANRLYCDAYYARAQHAQAEKHRHMTATQAGEFAREAGVDELVLIHLAPRYAGHYEAIVDEARAVFEGTTAELPSS